MTTQRLAPWIGGRGSADDLVFTPAVEILALFRARDLSPVEYMEAVVARAEAAEPSVGALADTYFPQAIKAARGAEERYMGRGRRPRALEGLPVAIKDEMAVAGQRNTQGSLIHRDAPPAETTAPLAQHVLDNGAIVHARTRTPEFSCVPFTHSRLWGVTRNPWNPDYDVGGSSGGSAAAIASTRSPGRSSMRSAWRSRRRRRSNSSAETITTRGRPRLVMVTGRVSARSCQRAKRRCTSPAGTLIGSSMANT